jgi:thioredoxin reductase
MQAIPANPWASPMDNGLNNASPLNYTDVDFTYPYDVVLTALQFLRDQSVSTTNDADFAARAIVIAYSTGSFNLRIADSQGYYLSNGMIVSANIQGDAASPYPLFPEIIIPAGGRIGIDIQDTSGNGNTIELLFRGVKRYRVA